MEIFQSPTGDEITTHGEYVQPLQSVKLLWATWTLTWLVEPGMGFCLSLGFDCVEVGLLGWGSITVRLRDAIEVVIFEEISSLPLYYID
jgi:hypothetical protein